LNGIGILSDGLKLPTSDIPVSSQSDANDAVYLLITNQVLADAFQPLVDRRTAQGKPGKLVTTEWIYASYDGTRPDGGTDQQTAIRNCIIDHYENHGTQCVFLGGDDTVVPIRYCVPEPGKDPVPADLYYADTDGGSWDTNGNGVYGMVSEVTTVELTPEVHIGRLPADDVADVTEYLKKVQIYETASPDGFANSMLCVCGDEPEGQRMSGDDRPSDFRDHDPVGGGEVSYRRLYRESIKPYWQASRFAKFFGAYTSWDQEVCGDYPLNSDNLTEKISEGHHHIAFSGHGNPVTWCLESGQDNFHADDAANLTNAIPSIVRSGGCACGAFDDARTTADPTLSEAFLLNPYRLPDHGGAVVFFAYSRTVSDSRQQDRLWDEMFQAGHANVGEAFSAMKAGLASLYVSNPYHHYIYLLLGDPAIDLLPEESGRNLGIDSPDGCEVIDTDMDITIRWSAAGIAFQPGEQVKLEYSDDSGSNWSPIPGAQALGYDSRNFVWADPGLPDGSNYRVRVMSLADPLASATSRTDFTVHQLGLLTVKSVLNNDDYGDLHLRSGSPVIDVGSNALIPPDRCDLDDDGDRTEPVPFDLDGDGNPRVENGTVDMGAYEGAYAVPPVGTVDPGDYGPPRDYYVNDDTPEDGFAAGDDANDGLTPLTPMRHIQPVLDRFADIDAIHVSDGTYVENLEIGAGDDNISLLGAGADVTIIDGNMSGPCLSMSAVANAEISGFTFYNGSESNGGGIHCVDSSFKLEDCRIEQNTITGYGAGMYIAGNSAPRIARCVFQANSTPWRGGAVCTRHTAAPQFDSCQFLGNSSGSMGGGMYNTEDAAPVVQNCLFVGNTSGSGGGAVANVVRSNALLANCTVVANVARDYGGGMLVADTSDSNTVNSIFWGNSADHNKEIYLRATPTLNVDYCDVQGGEGNVGVEPGANLIWGEGNLDVDPEFIRSPDDGGDGWGVGGNDDYGDLHLQRGSQCINKGDPDGNYAGQTDLDGMPRVRDGRVDMGAYEVKSPAQVVARHVFYNNSYWDGNDPAANTDDDNAIAPDPDHASAPSLGKTALLPGQPATFQHYTSYSRGINGIMVDVAALPDPDNLDATDFVFRVGNDNNPGSWPEVTAAASVSVRPHPTEAGTSRVTISWPDNAIEKQWLQVTMLVTDHTGLAENDVFYWGNAIGDSGQGNTSTFAFVTVTDELAARHNPHNLLNPAGIDDFVDYNRDRWVTVTDELIARHNGTNFLNALRMITVPESSGGGAGTAASDPWGMSSVKPVPLGVNQRLTQAIAPVLRPAPAAPDDSPEKPSPVRTEATSPTVLAAYDAVLKRGFATKSGSIRHTPNLPARVWLHGPLFAETQDSEDDDSSIDEALSDDWLYDWPSL
jgi:hypothetical protein